METLRTALIADSFILHIKGSGEQDPRVTKMIYVSVDRESPRQASPWKIEGGSPRDLYGYYVNVEYNSMQKPSENKNEGRRRGEMETHVKLLLYTQLQHTPLLFQYLFIIMRDLYVGVTVIDCSDCGSFR